MTVACPLHAIIAGLDQTLVATKRPPQDVLRRVYQRRTAICDHRRFDLTPLGLAEDSLSAARFPKEPSRAGLAGWGLVIKSPQPQPRIGMTSPALANSRHVALWRADRANRGSLRARAKGSSPRAARVQPMGQRHVIVQVQP